jgi:hypothetical protein
MVKAAGGDERGRPGDGGHARPPFQPCRQRQLGEKRQSSWSSRSSTRAPPFNPWSSSSPPFLNLVFLTAGPVGMGMTSLLSGNGPVWATSTARRTPGQCGPGPCKINRAAWSSMMSLCLMPSELSRAVQASGSPRSAYPKARWWRPGRCWSKGAPCSWDRTTQHDRPARQGPHRRAEGLPGLELVQCCPEERLIPGRAPTEVEDGQGGVGVPWEDRPAAGMIIGSLLLQASRKPSPAARRRRAGRPGSQWGHPGAQR